MQHILIVSVSYPRQVVISDHRKQQSKASCHERRTTGAHYYNSSAYRTHEIVSFEDAQVLYHFMMCDHDIEQPVDDREKIPAASI